ncbi:hypothetical protein A6C57_01035 [Fibrella sp. ES10-3-2-2]|nr:hypothetical protein A6C57_01035 [Fibrella sp. ES10-3-2-2]
MAATLYTRVTDAVTGLPVAGAAVSFVATGTGPALPGGFTNAQGEYAVVISWKFPSYTYVITVEATGYESGTQTLPLLGLLNQYANLSLSQRTVAVTAPLTYPPVVGVGQAPDLVVTLPTGPFDELIVRVDGAFPSVSRSPIPAYGPVRVPMANRLVVAPPMSLTLISHDDRFRPAADLRQTYTITITVRQGRLTWPVGTLTTTALLVDLPDLDTRLSSSPWLTPWPGTIPAERGGYTEVVAALPVLSTATTYNLFLTAHQNGIDGQVAFQETYPLTVPAGNAAYQPFRIRLPDYDTPALRLLIASNLGNLPALWCIYRSF